MTAGSAPVPPSRSHDEHFMRVALAEAAEAASLRDVPIGAVIVYDGTIVARGQNRREVDRDPTAHAELLALREAARHLGGWRLSGCSVYVTLEPCPMCAGALLLSRVDRLVYGAADPKAGAAGGIVDLFRGVRFNHTVQVTAGVCEAECREILQKFFATLRASP
ncbi:MAG TPA: tRNA adenosine(34) deaminase TadA [bacterium]|nr:tRNA adenosine(34) deaminase TadA [bacterium]